MNDRRRAKDALYSALARAAKGLGNGRRAELVDVLSQGPRSVQELAGEIGQSVANTSQHLHVLLDAGLVTTQAQGNRVIYALASPQVGELWMMLRQVATEHVDRVEQLAADYLGDRDSLGVMTRDDLAEHVARNDVVVLDVRPLPEYRSGHIVGAIHVPHAELRQRLAALPPDATFVAYCRGPFCVYADDAVRALTASGRTALRLDGGLPEWRAEGRPVAVQA